MHDDNNRYDWDPTITDVYRQVVGNSDIHTGVERQQAFDQCIPRIRDMVRRGDLTIPLDDMIRAALVRIDEREGASADKVLRRLVTGEDSLAFETDPLLNVVVTLGRGRRKPWRNIARADLIEMDRIRYENLRAVQNSYEEWRQTFPAALALVLQYGTFGEAAAAGAMHPLGDAA